MLKSVNSVIDNGKDFYKENCRKIKIMVIKT